MILPLLRMRTSCRRTRCWKSSLIPVILSMTGVAISAPPDETGDQGQAGYVKSASQPIPGATVSATQGTIVIVTTTDQIGHYSLQLGQGLWVVEVTMTGFQPVRKTLSVSNTAQELDFTLQLNESTVAATEGGSSARAPSEQNRNEGASSIETDSKDNQVHPVKPAENGDDANEAFLVSGTLNNAVSPSAAPGSSTPQPGLGDQSGRVGSSAGNPSAPGFAAGGSSSKRSANRSRIDAAAARQSGNRRKASQIHGTLTVRVENSAVNAKPFSITGQDIPQPSYAQSRFTFAVGGPLMIPKILKDANTFFFLNYSGTRYRNPYTAVETVPTELQRQGDFSQSIQSGVPVQIYDPLTHQPFFRNVIPENRIDPIALKLLTYFPLPNQPGMVNNYDFQASVARNTDDVDLRVQRNITNNDRLAFSLTFERRDGDVSQPFGFLDANSGSGLNTDLQWTRNISSRLIDTAHVAFKRNNNQTTPYFAQPGRCGGQLGHQWRFRQSP